MSYFGKTNNQLITGTINTLGGTVVSAFQGYHSIAAIITGTWTGEFVIEQSCDNQSTWHATQFTYTDGANTPFAGVTAITTSTINGTYKIICTGGVTHYRIRTTALSVGTLGVTMTSVDAAGNTGMNLSTVTQNIIASPTNSSTVNLNAGQTFTGTSVNTLTISAIQVLLKTDQNCTVWVDQAPTNALVDNPTGVTAATNNSTTITGTGSYFTRNFAIGDTIVFDPNSPVITVPIDH